MDRLTQLRTFVRVAERGSFSAAACDLQVTQSTVSKAITALEQSLGVRLVNRSTRSVSLNETGSAYYQRCRRILSELDEADAVVAGLQGHISGTLKIAAPVPFGLTFISPRVARFHMQHPGLQVEIDLDDRALNLVEEKIDVAIRLGDPGTPGLVARRLGDSRFVAVASLTYLAARGVPKRPEDLAVHNCLAYAHQSERWEWRTVRSVARTVNVSGNYRSNNLLALRDAALAGIGVARLPQWMVDAEIKSGALRRVLEDYHLPSFGIYAVFPSARQMPAKVRAFVEFMREELGTVAYFLG
jgi:DNA-binding transcriptional LysR family regulator